MQDEDDYTCNGCTSSFPPTSSSGSGGNPDDDLSGGDEEENCVPSPGQWICDLDDLIYEPPYCPTTSTYVDCWNQNGLLYMGEEPMNIDPSQWELLLTAIREQVHGLNRWQLIALALSYDTPFYNNSLYGLGEVPGTGCIDQYGCFDRSELNYIAQGELWAAAGVDFEDAESIVRFWKFMPIMHFSAEASGGTLIMLSVGYSDYEEHYPSDFP